MNNDKAMKLFRNFSESLASNPLLIQAAGGSTSIKFDSTMWVKASGRWLSQSQERDVMVPIKYTELLSSLYCKNKTDFEHIDSFVDNDQASVPDLRPSVETMLHAVLSYKVVAYVHCVNTLAWVVQRDAKHLLREALEGLYWDYVPYIRSGEPLARYVMKHCQRDIEVLILENQGLVIAAPSIEEAERLLQDITRRLSLPLRYPYINSPAIDMKSLENLAQNTGFKAAVNPTVHLLAWDSFAIKYAMHSALYPSHVTFLGPGAVIAASLEQARKAILTHTYAMLAFVKMVIIPNIGVFLVDSAVLVSDVLSTCLVDIISRIPSQATLKPLNEIELSQLVYWDAEKYRQQMNA